MSTWAVPSYADWAVPGYAEDGPLGAGLAGSVVAAVNEATGQRVAIKYLNDSLVHDGEFLRGLRAEIEQLSSLNAAHMARVFEYVEQPGEGAAVVTELIDGVSLREMIRRWPLGPRAALVVLKDTLLGLAAGHSRRVPHRDVKPENVLIDPNGWCTLTDFGLAVRPDTSVPAAGTPEYMAPELWNGAPHYPATDIYAATVMLCESLDGRPPFSGRPPALRDQHESAQVPLDPYDPPLRDLIAWGMAKYSDRRPPSAWAFAGEIDERGASAYGPAWEQEGRRELAERAAGLLGALAGGGNRGRRKTLVFASVAAVLLVAGVAAGAVMLKKPPVKVALSSVGAGSVAAQISGTPPTVVSKCHTPATFTFTGAITDQKKGSVSYQWQYSSGKPGPVQTLNFTTPGKQNVTSGRVTTSTAGTGWAQLGMLLNSGTKTSNKVTYSLRCSSAKGAQPPAGAPTAAAPTGAAPTAKTSAKASTSPTATKTSAAPTPTVTKPTPTPTPTPTKPTPTPTPPPSTPPASTPPASTPPASTPPASTSSPAG